MIGMILTILLEAFAIAIVFHFIAGALSLPLWFFSVSLFILAIIFYVINIQLIRYFISKRSPDFANDNMWEKTAGLGIVPKWVSQIMFLALAFAVAAILPWFWKLFK